MRVKEFFLVFLLSFFSIITLAQEKTKKEIKEEQKLIKQKEIENLINSKEYVFLATQALPQGRRNIILNSADYDVTFKEDKIISYLPYFGRAFSVEYGSSDGGMKFEGTPEDYKIEKKKKNYLITTRVKDSNDTYDLTLSIYFEGRASLTISSNRRSIISYDGTIIPLKMKDVN